MKLQIATHFKTYIDFKEEGLVLQITAVFGQKFSVSFNFLHTNQQISE